MSLSNFTLKKTTLTFAKSIIVYARIQLYRPTRNYCCLTDFQNTELGEKLAEKKHSEILKPKLTPHQNNTFSLD